LGAGSRRFKSYHPDFHNGLKAYRARQAQKTCQIALQLCLGTFLLAATIKTLTIKIPNNNASGSVQPEFWHRLRDAKTLNSLSVNTFTTFLRRQDDVGVTISRGQLSKLVQKAATALEQAYNELLGYFHYRMVL
jgi:hypothetical protein